ncbi:MAG: hypothetical protein AAF557_23175 [Pseudomonadota bacterium]
MAITELERPGDGPGVIIRDETPQRSEAVEMLLRLASAQLTAADLIAERVRAECDSRLLDRQGQTVAPLVPPNADETVLNGPKHLLKFKSENVDAQIHRAQEAFQQNAFVLLVDDSQVEALEDPVEIRENSVVTFLRLTPLVGG